MLHYLENLIATDAKPGNPWEFKCTEVITDDIRKKKTVRQEFYNNPGTKHSFYSGIEPLNPNARLNKKSNPPQAIHWVFADYDTLNLPHERVLEGTTLMPHKPARIERSLGENWRLGFQLPFSILCDGDHDRCSFILKKMESWLQLNALPCLDTQAFVTPTRYLCNGCQWVDTGAGPISETALQAFLVSTLREYDKFQAPVGDDEVPLDVVEKALREKFGLAFNWPGPFVEGSQGPSFWVEGSTSPNSAVVKKGGMISFAAHADQQFSPWSKILGPEFSKKWGDEAIAKATKDIWYDGHDYWMKGPEGVYRTATERELTNYLKVNCRLSSRPDKQTGLSQIDHAFNHIYRNSRVDSAGSFVMRPSGIIMNNGARKLNTYFRKPLEPAAGGPYTWDDVPFIASVWKHLFRFEEDPKPFWTFIAWLRLVYIAAYTWNPRQGHNIFIAGVRNCGKTLTNCHIIPPLLGGSMDCSEYVLGQSMFNAHLFEVPYWTIDDEVVVGSPGSMARTSNMFKKIAANQTAMSHGKFQKQAMVDWLGRLGVTLNLDTISMRLIGPQDEATLEKTNIFRGADNSYPNWPHPDEIRKLVQKELPILAWLLLNDTTCQGFVIPYSRYGFESFQDPILLDRTNQSQSVAPFKEMYSEELTSYFFNTPGAKDWRGTVVQIVRLLAATPLNDHALRGIKLEQVNRYLEQIQKEGSWGIRCENGPMRTRVWVVERTAFESAILTRFGRASVDTAAPVEEITPPTTTKNPFEK